VIKSHNITVNGQPNAFCSGCLNEFKESELRPLDVDSLGLGLKPAEFDKQSLQIIISQFKNWKNIFKKVDYFSMMHEWLHNYSITGNKEKLQYVYNGIIPLLARLSKIGNLRDKSDFYIKYQPIIHSLLLIRFLLKEMLKRI